MPELANESPCQDELRVYLQEHMARSMFAPLGMTAEAIGPFIPARPCAGFWVFRAFGRAAGIRRSGL